MLPHMPKPAKRRRTGDKLAVPAFLGPVRRLRIASARNAAMWQSFGVESNVVKKYQIPGFVMNTQQDSNWCWAAVVQAVLINNQRQTLSQQDIVRKHINNNCQPNTNNQGFGTCTAAPCQADCNSIHDIEFVLKENNILNDSIDLLFIKDKMKFTSSIKFQSIIDEINNNRPIVGLISPPNRIGGHFVAITGYQSGSAGQQFVTLHYPRFEQGALHPVGSVEVSYQALIDSIQLNDGVSTMQGHLTWSYTTTRGAHHDSSG